MDSLSRLHSDYQAELWVVAAWNGSGTALVFTSLDAYERFINEYEEFRVAHSLPWLHGKEAVNGEHIMAMYDIGLRPWRVSLGPTGDVLAIHAMPMHHIKLQLIVARYNNGHPRVLEVWAEDEFRAQMYTQDMMEWRFNPDSTLADDIDFGMEEVSGTMQRTEEHVMPAPAPPAPANVIPGFGTVADLSKL